MGVTLDLNREDMPLIMRASLSLVSQSHSLRCDAKQAEKRFAAFDHYINSIVHFVLGDYLPDAFIKGEQPRYIESSEPTGIPVINTLAIQNLTINVEACRYISEEDFDAIDAGAKPKCGDVLLTVDGGTSIGKPAFYELEGDYAIDSHVVILRPRGLDPKALVHLLASPLGQLQFQQAESGASGQTAVTEEDIRRFRFPALREQEIERLVKALDAELATIRKAAQTLQEREKDTWDTFSKAILEKARRTPAGQQV